MDVYADVMVPRMFEPWARELLGELAARAGEAGIDVAVAELSRPLMADGTLRSQLASHLAIARR